MTFQVSDFVGQVALNAMIHNAYANRVAELTAIATALGSDASTHDTTITTAPAGLQPGNPANSHFTNDVLLVVGRSILLLQVLLGWRVVQLEVRIVRGRLSVCFFLRV